MQLIESLPNLTVLKGLNPEIQYKDTFLDNLFQSCGRTLLKLEFSLNGQMPKALLQNNSVLKKLKIVNQTPFPLMSKLVGTICQTKQQGFRFKLSNTIETSRIHIYDYISCAKLCPNTILEMDVKVPDSISFFEETISEINYK